MKLRIAHCELAEANAFVEIHHRHHEPVIQHRYSIAVLDDRDGVHGVVIVGRPRARGLDAHEVVEIYRCATFGTYNACSKLYGAARRAAKELGYSRIITYILTTEDGRSLKGAGFVRGHLVRGRTWDTPSRRRSDNHPTCDKWFYYSELARKVKHLDQVETEAVK